MGRGAASTTRGRSVARITSPACAPTERANGRRDQPRGEGRGESEQGANSLENKASLS